MSTNPSLPWGTYRSENYRHCQKPNTRCRYCYALCAPVVARRHHPDTDQMETHEVWIPVEQEAVSGSLWCGLHYLRNIHRDNTSQLPFHSPYGDQ